MMLVPADIFDVVERVGPVAEAALVHLRMFLASDLHGHHFEMLHIVTGRRLMALRALFGGR